MSCTSLPNCTSVIHPTQSSNASWRPPILLIFDIIVHWYLRLSGLAKTLCILTGIDAHRILTQGMQGSTCAGCICVGAFIFHPDAVEFIKCTKPRGALLSLGLVHFMLILWMQWYMKRGTLCAKAPGIGRKCAKRPLTVTASYSTGVMFLLDLDVPCLLSKNGMYYCLQWSQVILNK